MSMERFCLIQQELKTLRKRGTVVLVDRVTKRGLVEGRIAVVKKIVCVVKQACGHYIGWGIRV